MPPKKKDDGPKEKPILGRFRTNLKVCRRCRRQQHQRQQQQPWLLGTVVLLQYAVACLQVHGISAAAAGSNCWRQHRGTSAAI